MIIKRLEELIAEKTPVIGERNGMEMSGTLTGLNWKEGRFVYFIDTALNNIYTVNIECDTIREVKRCVNVN